MHHLCVLLVIFFVSVASGFTTPAKPVLPEDFTAITKGFSVPTYAQDSSNNATYSYNGQLTVVDFYDTHTQYNWNGGQCWTTEVDGYMPQAWSYLPKAGYNSTIVYEGQNVDIWTAEWWWLRL